MGGHRYSPGSEGGRVGGGEREGMGSDVDLDGGERESVSKRPGEVCGER